MNLVSAGCGSNAQPAQAAGRSAPGSAGAPVTVSIAEQQPVPIEIDVIGNAQPYRTVQVKSMVDGQIEKVLFEQGQDVKAGQLLFQLDKRPFEAALHQAQGKLAQDQATAANSKAQAERATSLLREGIMAAQDAQAIQAQAAAASAAVQADEAAVETARVNLGYTDIRAPIDGRAGAILVNLGNLVKANDTNPLTTLNQIEPLYVSFNIPEGNLPAVRAKGVGKLKVSAYVPNDPRPSVGTLTFIDNAVDQTTGTIKLMGTFANRDRRLWPGAFVNVRLQLGVEPNAVVVPTAAVQTGPQGKYVYIVQQNGTALMQPVNSSRTYGQLSVIASGVQAGQKVIVDGQIRVVPNGKVNIIRTAPLPGLQQQQSPAAESASISGIQP